MAAGGSADRGWGHDPLLQSWLSWWGINLLERGREDGGAALGSQGAADGHEGGDQAEKYLGEPADHQAQLHG